MLIITSHPIRFIELHRGWRGGRLCEAKETLYLPAMVSLMIQVNENDWRLKCNRQFYGEGDCTCAAR